MGYKFVVMSLLIVLVAGCAPKTEPEAPAPAPEPVVPAPLAPAPAAPVPVDIPEPVIEDEQEEQPSLPTVEQETADEYVASLPDGADYFVCPMHPQVVSDKADACPLCNMTLERKQKDAEPDDEDPDEY